MSPARGCGANVALLEASNLCTALTEGDDLVAAIGGYEEKMRAYGFAAVEASRLAETQTVRRTDPRRLWTFTHLPNPGARSSSERESKIDGREQF